MLQIYARGFAMRRYTDFGKRKNIKSLYRRIYAFALLVVYLSVGFAYVDSIRTFAETIVESDNLQDGNEKGDNLTQTELSVFHRSEKRDFTIESDFMSASFYVTDNGSVITGLKNNSSEFEWIDGKSVAALVDVYYDDKNALKEFGWKYYGCYEYANLKKLIFEFKSGDNKFICRQNWQICKTDSDGAVIVMSFEIEHSEKTEIRLPERFSAVNMQLKSDVGYYMQYLNGTIKDETVEKNNTIGFKSGNGNGFEMSVPLLYFNAAGTHGIALGGGSFSPGKTAVLNARANAKTFVCDMDFAYNVTTNGNGTVYSYPSFFAAIYGGNNSVGKNFIKNWNVSDSEYKDESLPLTYEKVVGKADFGSVEETRNSFFNMMFCFSVSDARQNKCEKIRDELLKCEDSNSAIYKYILRSAIFSEFDYKTVGLADGSPIKKSAAEHDELYRNSLASAMLNGRQYPIFPGYSKDGWDGIEFYDTVNKKGVIFAFRNSEESDTQKVIAVQGVSEDIEYKVISLDGSVNIEKIQGAELLAGGLNVTMKNGGLSDIIFIEEAEIDFADVKILLFGNELSSLEIIAIAAVLILLIGIVITAIIVNAQDEYKEKKF